MVGMALAGFMIVSILCLSGRSNCPVVVYCSLGCIHLLSNPHDSILRSPLFYYFFPFVLLFVGDTYIVVFIPTLVLVSHDN